MMAVPAKGKICLHIRKKSDPVTVTTSPRWGSCMVKAAGSLGCDNRQPTVYAFFTNSDFSCIAPMPSILQSMS
jgi:hypothetical protein